MEWFENEEFCCELYRYMSPPERFAPACDRVAQIVALAGFPVGQASGLTNGHKVLDLCSGPGRHALAFAQRGFDVTGVDRSQFMLDRVRERATELQSRWSGSPGDMRSFIRPGTFDLACNLFTSFGYFKQEEDNLQVLQNVYQSLTDGAVFVIETLGKQRLAKTWQNAICTEFPDGSLLLQRPQVRDDWRRIPNQWVLMKDGRYRTFSFDNAVCSGRELKVRLLASGFQEVHLFGDLQGAPFGLHATRLLQSPAKRGPHDRGPDRARCCPYSVRTLS